MLGLAPEQLLILGGALLAVFVIIIVAVISARSEGDLVEQRLNQATSLNEFESFLNSSEANSDITTSEADKKRKGGLDVIWSFRLSQALWDFSSHAFMCRVPSVSA